MVAIADSAACAASAPAVRVIAVKAGSALASPCWPKYVAADAARSGSVDPSDAVITRLTSSPAMPERPRSAAIDASWSPPAATSSSTLRARSSPICVSACTTARESSALPPSALPSACVPTSPPMSPSALIAAVRDLPVLVLTSSTSAVAASAVFVLPSAAISSIPVSPDSVRNACASRGTASAASAWASASAACTESSWSSARAASSTARLAPESWRTASASTTSSLIEISGSSARSIKKLVAASLEAVPRAAIAQLRSIIECAGVAMSAMVVTASSSLPYSVARLESATQVSDGERAFFSSVRRCASVSCSVSAPLGVPETAEG